MRMEPNRRENGPGFGVGGSLRGYLAAYRVSRHFALARWANPPFFSGFCYAKTAFGGADETLLAAPEILGLAVLSGVHGERPGALGLEVPAEIRKKIRPGRKISARGVLYMR